MSIENALATYYAERGSSDTMRIIVEDRPVPVKTPEAKRLMQCFLLSQEQWRAIYHFQKGLCGVCGNPLDKRNKKGKPSPIHTDHRHKDGLIRGLLCFRCNATLGEIMTIDFVRKVLAYLENLPATGALGAPHYGLPGRTGTKAQTKLRHKLAKESLAKVA